MRKKIAAIIVLAMATVLTGVAHAVTLTITEGTISLSFSDRFANFSGDDFSVSMISPSGAASVIGSPFTTGIVSTPLPGTIGAATVLWGG